MVLCWRRHGRVGGCRIKKRKRSESFFGIKAKANGGVAQLGEHLPCKQGVMSSNLTISTLAMRSGNLKISQASSLLVRLNEFLNLYGECRDEIDAKHL